MNGPTKICLGTAQFGLDYGINNQSGKLNYREIVKILDYAWQHGVSDLDCADAYGDALNVLGAYNLESGVRFNIHSKFSNVGVPLRATIEQSLSKLHLTSIDIFYFHNYSDFIRHPEFHQQMIDLKSEGLINKIGISVYENAEFQAASKYEFIDVIQFPFNLLDNLSQRKKNIDIATRNGKQLHVRSVYLQGLFFMPIQNIPEKLAPLIPYLNELKRVAKTSNVKLEQMAINFVLQSPNIEQAIIGVDSLDQLKQNLNYSELKISLPIIQEINKIVVSNRDLLYPKSW
jgi:uncharacterized protein